MSETGLIRRAGLAAASLFLVFGAFAVVDTWGTGRSGSSIDTTDDNSDEQVTLDIRETLSVTGNPTLHSGTIPGSSEDGETQPAADDDGVAQAAVAAPAPAMPANAFEPIRNTNPLFTGYASTPSNQLSVDALTESVSQRDNGSNSMGEFRVACEYSHFAYDDPIIYPGEPGASHLHMFFGNTAVNAHTTADSLLDTGGGSCNGFELNRSGYWFPALLDGKGSVVVPDQIIVYYKTKRTNEVIDIPQGLALIAGNLTGESFNADFDLHWSCGPSGHSYNKTNRIPDCGGDVINATVVFPDCWDGVNLESDDFTSHMTYGTDSSPCPSSHPKRIPKITVLLYFPGVSSVDGWHLASDDMSSYNAVPGGTLHADWWGGWNAEATKLWTDNCLRAARNCSYGQTGTSRKLAALNDLQTYPGDNFLTLPDGR